MNTDHIAILVLIPLVCGLFIGGALPLALGQVQPNRVYGFQTGRRIKSLRAWYSVNRVVGWWGIVTGVVGAATFALMLGAGWAIAAAAFFACGILGCGALAMALHGAMVCWRLDKANRSWRSK